MNPDDVLEWRRQHRTPRPVVRQARDIVGLPDHRQRPQVLKRPEVSGVETDVAPGGLEVLAVRTDVSQLLLQRLELEFFNPITRPGFDLTPVVGRTWSSHVCSAPCQTIHYESCE